MLSPFRKMKNHQVRTEKQRMLHQTMVKVRPSFYHRQPQLQLLFPFGAKLRSQVNAGTQVLVPKAILVS